jgi:hypothetical protein
MHPIAYVPIIVLHFVMANGQPKAEQRVMPREVCQHSVSPQTAAIEVLGEHPDWTFTGKWECGYDYESRPA